jgi:hypothetical protein
LDQAPPNPAIESVACFSKVSRTCKCHLGELARIFYLPQETYFMPNKTTRGRGQDRSKVAGGQAHEVHYESQKTGASPKEVKRAVKTAGNNRKKIEKRLGK